MRTSGLPCRADPTCDVVFSPTDQTSLQSLLDAASQRNAHELDAHGYTHRPHEIAAPNYAAGPRTRPRRTRDLNPVS